MMQPYASFNQQLLLDSDLADRLEYVYLLYGMVTLLAKINPDQADICTFVMEQINSRVAIRCNEAIEFTI